MTTEVVDSLALTADACVFDGTLGSGGHTKALAENLNQDGCIVACDIDSKAIEKAEAWCRDYEPKIFLVNDNFANVQNIIQNTTEGQLNGCIADLGWRSEQFADSGRGFSFQKDEPLIMTLGEPDDYTLLARDILNEWDEEDIANVLYGYGEERYARKIAHTVVSKRQEQSLATTQDLVDCILEAVPAGYKSGKIHPATKSFQALRIAVNDELKNLTEFIDNAWKELVVGGRISIITFHSIEDRVVKQKFRSLKDQGEGELLTKKPVTPSVEEVRENPRARSAKLRTVIKL